MIAIIIVITDTGPATGIVIATTTAMIGATGVIGIMIGIVIVAIVTGIEIVTAITIVKTRSAVQS
jgi:hypothetical protein